jgi:hypothetical protein
VWLAGRVIEFLNIPFKKIRYFMDSSAVFGMLKTDSGKYSEFEGTSIREVKVSSDVGTDVVLAYLPLTSC